MITVQIQTSRIGSFVGPFARPILPHCQTRRLEYRIIGFSFGWLFCTRLTDLIICRAVSEAILILVDMDGVKVKHTIN